ncbi:50S ribosomal protein L32 [Candidatus Tremblaya princeps]|uniref:Large ribosomal subunit protein bL32 n=1 Tax=Tremblaya princeps TaxID=189385 RepID=A0A143WN92_TREPR|nr:50S ribosomal protein L32 [Candidatus Tremblaya princeps]
MAAPKRKKSTSRRNMRRHSGRLRLPAISTDRSGNMHLRHYATIACRGYGRLCPDNTPTQAVEGEQHG